MISKILTHRMSLWLWISIGLLIAIYFLARHMVGVVIYKIALITIAGYVGYGLSLAIEGAMGRAAAKRPHEYRADAAIVRGQANGFTAASRAEALDRAWQLEQLAAWMLWRRAAIVAAVLVASALGG